MDPDLRPQTPSFNPNPNPQNIYDMPPIPSSMQNPPRKKRFGAKKWLLVSGAGVLVIGALAAAWAFYYNNPGRVLADVFNEVTTSKTAGYNGTLTTTGKGDFQFESVMNINGEIDENMVTANTTNDVKIGAIEVNLDVDLMVTDQSTAYVKLTNAAELGALIQTVMSGNPYASSYAPLFDQLENTWIEFDSNSEESMGGGITSTCDTQKLTDWTKSEEQTLRNLFNENKFIDAKRNGFSLTDQHYSLTINNQALQRFVDQVNALESYQDVKESCDLTKDFSSENWPTVTMDIWVSPWTHDLKRLHTVVDDETYSSTIDMNLDLGKEVNIQVPADAKTFKEIMDEFKQDQMPDEAILQEDTTTIEI